jgi:hypothetical protein
MIAAAMLITRLGIVKRKIGCLRSQQVGALPGLPATPLGCGLLGQQHLCHVGLGHDIFPLLEHPAGGVEQPGQRQAPGLGHEPRARGSARSDVLGEHLDEVEDQLPCGAADRGKAPRGRPHPDH